MLWWFRRVGPYARGMITGQLVGKVVIAGLVVVGAGLLVAGPLLYREVRARTGRETVQSRVASIGPRVEPLWQARLSRAGLTAASLASRQITLLTIKDQRLLHVFVSRDDGSPAWLATFPVTAASGGPGPKLREGDRQVPEGVYAIESLNPNSRYHLALRVAYPSEADREQAKLDGRANLGGDIMIHGGAGSIGCIAIGDPAIEEVFWLAATAGHTRVRCVIAPSRSPLELITPQTPAWVGGRYRQLDEELKALLAELPK